ncbi:MAG: Type A flavoprotein FprA [Methanonatronarchaeales archaeon]|nr:Type A flavoprotein FprA [Methanonatronarchaeales archaeon]
MTEIRPDVNWVGAIDWDIRECGAYTTPHGTTYNSYLVEGEESTALVDAVKRGFADQVLYRIRKHMDPGEVDYLVCLHAEPDHAGDIGALAEATGAEVVCREKCRDALEGHLAGDLDYVSREDGETLELGERSLRVIDASMLHWPDSTFAYLEDENVLFPNDAFGQHVASSTRFADETRWVMEEATRYYAAILQMYSGLVSRKLEELGELEIDVIAPAHGTVWRPAEEAAGDGPTVGDVLEKYGQWSGSVRRDKAVVAYDTMWGSTGKMARAIAEGLMEGGYDARVYHLRSSDFTDVAAEILESRALFLGSPTINSTIYPSVGEFLTFLEGLRHGGDALAFGSYGWASAAERELSEQLREAGFDVDEGLTSRYVPADDALVAYRRLGREYAEAHRAP